jgi:uncharacterized repeat protein (TIGR01451 family)
MWTTTTLLRTLTLATLAGACLITAGIAPGRTLAESRPTTSDHPSALSITTPRFITVTTTGSSAPVSYLAQVSASDPSAGLGCVPGEGSFPRGATEVLCTATLGEETATARFFVLVANGDDTDVSLSGITHTPENPVRPSSELSYLIELRNNGLNTARQVLVSGTLPEAIEVTSYNTARCTLTPERLFACTIFGLNPGKGDVLALGARVRPGVTGNFQLQLAVSLSDGQVDLEPSLNSYTKTTVIEDPGFGPNAIYIPLVRQ